MIHVPQLSVKLPWSKHNTKWLKPLKKTGWISLPRKPWKIGWSIWQFNSSLWNHHLLPWAIYAIANCKKSPEVNINWTNSLLLFFFLRLNSSWKHVFKHIQTLHSMFKTAGFFKTNMSSRSPSRSPSICSEGHRDAPVVLSPAVGAGAASRRIRPEQVAQKSRLRHRTGPGTTDQFAMEKMETSWGNFQNSWGV